MNLRVFYLTRRGISDGYVSLFPCGTKIDAKTVTIDLYRE